MCKQRVGQRKRRARVRVVGYARVRKKVRLPRAEMMVRVRLRCEVMIHPDPSPY